MDVPHSVVAVLWGRGTSQRSQQGSAGLFTNSQARQTIPLASILVGSEAARSQAVKASRSFHPILCEFLPNVSALNPLRRARPRKDREGGEKHEYIESTKEHTLEGVAFALHTVIWFFGGRRPK